MGKYMKKSKMAGDVALVMEVSPGVCTRAKTLALQRLQKTTLSPPLAPNPDASSFSYLQLRSRRLQKPPLLFKQQHPKECCRENPSPSPRPNSRFRVGSVDSASAGSESVNHVQEQEQEQGCFGKFWKGVEAEEGSDFGVEASFGENNFDFDDGRDRSTRENTPCSLIMGSDSIGTPGSTTRRTSTETNRRVRNEMQRNIPTTQEMEEFFAFAEQQQQRLFIEKYNFDVINDLPLPGQYEWVQVTP